VFFNSNSIIPQWIPQNSNTNQRLLTLFFLDENNGWAGGNEGCIIRTTDGGNNWNYFSIGTKYTVHSVHFVDSLKGWAALYSFIPYRAGYIMNTTDGGASWNLQLTVDNHTLHNVYFYDQYFGWAIGSSGVFLRTVDGGNNWEFNLVSDQWNWALYFISPNNGWIGDGYSGYIQKTTNGGYSWQLKAIPTYFRIMDIYFINDNVGWAVGQDGVILKSTNGGETWNHQTSGTFLELNDVKFANVNCGWVVGMNGVILHTTDGGINWYPQGNLVTNDLYGLSVKSDLLGWIGGTGGIIMKTQNGGGDPLPVELVSFTGECNTNEVLLNWTTASELNNSGFDIQRKFENNDWITIGFTKGSGTTTEVKHYNFIDRIDNNSPKKYFYRLRQIDFNGKFEFSEAIEIDINVPSEFKLFQNYPNPFNPNTLIRFQLPERSEVTLKIYDILGNEVETLLNDVKDAGFYNVDFNASKLASGIYFYLLQTEKYSKTFKMILLK